MVPNKPCASSKYPAAKYSVVVGPDPLPLPKPRPHNPLMRSGNPDVSCKVPLKLLLARSNAAIAPLPNCPTSSFPLHESHPPGATTIAQGEFSWNTCGSL